MNSSDIIEPSNLPGTAVENHNSGAKTVNLLVRIFAFSVVAVMLIFLINNYLNSWQQWPGLPSFFANQGWFGLELLRTPLAEDQITKGWLQFLSYLGAVVIVVLYVLQTRNRSLRSDADLLSRFSAYIIRAAFWIVLIIGLADILISFLRVENFMPAVGEVDGTR